jgi:hypothetical protein
MRRSLEWCRIARGSGQPGDFDVPVIIVFAASDRAAWRRSIGIGIGAIVVYGSAPTAHSITAHCPPAHDEDSDITAHCPPAYDEDSDALAGAALGSPSVMSKSAICSRRPSESTKTPISARCSAAFFLVGVATSAFSSSSAHQVLDSSASVERAGKADRLKHVEDLVSADDAIAVELTGPSDIVIRDRYGNVLFAVDHSARMTTVGKRRGRRAIFPEAPGTEERALPEGCEGAFSPYVEPLIAVALTPSNTRPQGPQRRARQVVRGTPHHQGWRHRRQGDR